MKSRIIIAIIIIISILLVAGILPFNQQLVDTTFIGPKPNQSVPSGDEPGGILDQYQNLTIGHYAIGAVGDTLNFSVAQGFTPAKPIVTRVELYIKNEDLDATLPYFVAIRDNLTGDDLTKVGVSPEEISHDLSWVEFDFRDIPVTIGQTYYIVSYATRYENNRYHWGWYWNETEDNYPNGTTSFRLSPDRPYNRSEGDCAFKTYGRDSNSPPGTPDQPDGPTNGFVNVVYIYSVDPVTDPDGDEVQYKFDWNATGFDYSEWISIPTARHIWSETGNYEIRVKARDDLGAESDWSEPLVVNISIPLPELLISPESPIWENQNFWVRITSEGTPVDNVNVRFNNEFEITNSNGDVTFTAPSVTKTTPFDITATKEGYIGDKVTITVLNQKEQQGWIYGAVYNNSQVPIEDVSVCAMPSDSDTISKCAFTDQNGSYILSLPVGTYTVEASKKGYETSTKYNITVEENSAIEINFQLQEEQAPSTEGTDSNKEFIEWAIDREASEGKIGGKIYTSPDGDNITYYSDEITIELNSTEETVSFTIGAENGTNGTIIVIYIGEGVLEDLDNVNLTYDGLPIQEITDVAAFFGTQGPDPIWLRVLTLEGLYVFVRIPKFSTHTITITSIVETITDVTAITFYIIISFIATFIFIGPRIKNIIYRKYYLKNEEE